jgi:hypothetical protein
MIGGNQISSLETGSNSRSTDSRWMFLSGKSHATHYFSITITCRQEHLDKNSQQD